MRKSKGSHEEVTKLVMYPQQYGLRGCKVSIFFDDSLYNGCRSADLCKKMRKFAQSNRRISGLIPKNECIYLPR